MASDRQRSAELLTAAFAHTTVTGTDDDAQKQSICYVASCSTVLMLHSGIGYST